MLHLSSSDEFICALKQTNKRISLLRSNERKKRHKKTKRNIDLTNISSISETRLLPRSLQYKDLVNIDSLI